MGTPSDGAFLYLRISHALQIREFELSPGESVEIGRGDECKFVMPLDSISVQHLRLSWDGQELEVRDLESSNGSFRMPQNAPFVVAKFSAERDTLHLKIAKEPLQISWRKRPRSLAQIAEKMGELRGPPGEKKESPNAPAKTAESKQTKPSAQNLKQVQAWLALWLLIFVALFSFHALWVERVGASFFRLPDKLLRIGAALDFSLLYLQMLWRAWLPLSLMGIVLFFIFISRFRALQKGQELFKESSLKNLRYLIWMPRSPGLGFLLLGLVAVVGFAWPFLWAMGHGVNSRQLGQALAYASSREGASFKSDPSQPKLQEKKIEAIHSAAMKGLKGSSLLYIDWYRVQQDRIFKECEASGRHAWEGKRYCLLLLHGMAMEGISIFQPALLGEEAILRVLLSSLDGVTRVLAAEGPSSVNIEPFLDSLSSLGLVAERQQYHSLIRSFEGMNVSLLLNGLRQMRFQVEERLVSLQKSVPREFYLDTHGPLEMGI